MRIVCLSDTHTLTAGLQVPAGDVLVHAGDWCGRGDKSEAVGFADWLLTLPHEHKVVVAGNHDWVAEKDPEWTAALFAGYGITYICDSSVAIDGLKFYGAPWQPEFCNWAFNLPRGRALAEKWAQIPDDTDVLITHGPPAGILDMVNESNRPGCHDLRARVAVVRPKLHVFGHIHEGYGRHRRHDTQFVNAAVCDGRYRPVNKPIVVEL